MLSGACAPKSLLMAATKRSSQPSLSKSPQTPAIERCVCSGNMLFTSATGERLRFCFGCDGVKAGFAGTERHAKPSFWDANSDHSDYCPGPARVRDELAARREPLRK